MRAVLFERSGSTDGLVLRDVPEPVPGPTDLLIDVRAATVTQGDVVIRKMPRLLARVFGLGGKRVLGHEFAGVVVGAGAATTRYRPGDHVFGTTSGLPTGSHAERICVPEDGVLAEIPSGVPFEAAAPIPIGGLTALTLLRRAGALPDDPDRILATNDAATAAATLRVLVHGASGSVGTYAVQLAAHAGAKVTGITSTANLELVRSLGASSVIDYTSQDLASVPERFDAVIDAVGKGGVDRAKALLVPGGGFASVRSRTSEAVADLWLLRDLLGAGAIRAVVDRTYPLDQIRDAHAYVESGRKRGNVLITVAPTS